MPDSIPTTAAIAEAKKRRERMRAEGGGTGSDGFISLEVGFASKSGESRLVREDDEIGDGDEGELFPMRSAKARADPSSFRRHGRVHWCAGDGAIG